MASLKEVKNRIGSVISTQQITKAMKMVAAAKLRKSQERITQMRPFAQKMNTILQNLSASGSDQDDWYAKSREINKVLIVVVTSDRGLCGSFNSNVIKNTIRVIQENYPTQADKKNVTILPIGKKGFEFFTKRGFNVIGDYSTLFQNLTFDKVAECGEVIMSTFRKGEYDRVEIVYNQFKNVATQILQVEQFLPVKPQAAAKKGSDIDYIFQPNQEEILSGLVPKSLKVQLYKSVLDSNASENGARMTAMDKASENAGELLKELKLSYNRTRQAAITKEILEIVGGAEALKAG
jgi:F-type H+-transporting ATPase subunit gamma